MTSKQAPVTLTQEDIQNFLANLDNPVETLGTFQKYRHIAQAVASKLIKNGSMQLDDKQTGAQLWQEFPRQLEETLINYPNESSLVFSTKNVAIPHSLIHDWRFAIQLQKGTFYKDKNNFLLVFNIGIKSPMADGVLRSHNKNQTTEDGGQFVKTKWFGPNTPKITVSPDMFPALVKKGFFQPTDLEILLNHTNFFLDDCRNGEDYYNSGNANIRLFLYGDNMYVKAKPSISYFKDTSGKLRGFKFVLQALKWYNHTGLIGSSDYSTKHSGGLAKESTGYLLEDDDDNTKTEIPDINWTDII